MAEFFIQERQLSRVTRTIVKDSQGKSLFLLVGRWGTKGDALSLYKMSGELVASIKQVSFTFGTRFEIYQGFDKVGTLKKIFNWPGDFYYIRQLHWTVQGNIHQHQYAIHHFNRLVMEMDKTTLLTGDYYVLNIPIVEEAPLCICIAAIMDYWLYNRKKDKINYQLNFTTH
ncbi:hypothetical protein BAU15_03715 [Enterococcus sp. JM4C]|uniref:LURP-one-related/scramblase family protein n=1 Tax=Candidatus Enterococcus huntleyi TaxID=1857217 RepID=UPI001379D436|nr:hypothetical protein [Enterococcus sp. JM4C]KAF1295659.1 hypothetical protein BAU15_03715 [Enterococcus sp. JM4C]